MQDRTSLNCAVQIWAKTKLIVPPAGGLTWLILKELYNFNDCIRLKIFS